MTKPDVGKEILSHCNKCKLPLAHIILTMKTPTRAGKVQCKTCNNSHAYKKPPQAKKKKVKKKAKKTAKRKSRTLMSPEESLDIWNEKIAHAQGKKRSYSIAGKFQLGDVINHSKFGEGFVDRLIDHNKIQVIFRTGVKTLIHNHS